MLHRGPAAAVIVASVALIAYATSLMGMFHYDDLPTIVQNPAVRDASLIPDYFTDPTLFSGTPGNSMYRPVLLLTYLGDYSMWGLTPKGWHVTNTLLHALNACLVLVLARRLFRLFREKSAGVAAFLSGLAFALHPVHTESVNYISSRSGSIAAAGFLGALILHIAWTRGGRSGLTRAALLAGSLALFAIGLGGKEVAVALLPTIFFLELLDPEAGPLRKRLRQGILRSLPAFLLLGGYLVLRQHVLGVAVADVGGRVFSVPGREDPFWGGGRTVYQNLLTQSRVFWHYIYLLVLPVDLALDHFYRVSLSIREPGVLLSLGGLVVLAAGLVWAIRKRPLVGLCGLVFLFGLAPTSTIIPLNVLMNEHRLYLPGVGFAILTGLALAALIDRRPRAGVVLAAVIGTCYLGIVTARNLEWSDPHTLWASNVESSPRSFRARNQLGVLEYRAAERMGFGPASLPLLDRAIVHYRVAEEVYPQWYAVLQNLAFTHQKIAQIRRSQAEFDRAVHYWERCIELQPRSPVLKHDLALLFGLWGNCRQASLRLRALAVEQGEEPAAFVDRTFKEVLERTPRDPRAYLAFAGVLALRDPPDRERAKELYERAVALGHKPLEGEFERLFE